MRFGLKPVSCLIHRLGKTHKIGKFQLIKLYKMIGLVDKIRSGVMMLFHLKLAILTGNYLNHNQQIGCSLDKIKCGLLAKLRFAYRPYILSLAELSNIL